MSSRSCFLAPHRWWPGQAFLGSRKKQRHWWWEQVCRAALPLVGCVAQPGGPPRQALRPRSPGCLGPVLGAGFLRPPLTQQTDTRSRAGNVCVSARHQAPTLCAFLFPNNRGAFSCGDCSRVVTSPLLRRHLQVFLDCPLRPQCTVRVKVGTGGSSCICVHLLRAPFTRGRAGVASPALFLGKGAGLPRGAAALPCLT